MRARRGVAIIVALWLIVAIGAVAVQFALDARERRIIGLDASERGQQRALASGAMALMQARLEYALRVAPTGNNVARLRASDPWLDVDSIYSGTVYVDSLPVDVQVRDLGTQLNVNLMGEIELRTFFQFAIGDYTLADKLAQSIMDWRDTDSIPRLRGAERDAYIKAEKLALPTNAAFREVSEMLDVMYMTPEIYALVSPYLSTHGSNLVNLNTAPAIVLRTLPGMTDAMLNNILQLRSQGRRISTVQEIFGGGVAGGGRGRAGIVQSVQVQQNIAGRATVDTREIELTITARLSPSSRPTRYIVDVNRNGNSATIRARQW